MTPYPRTRRPEPRRIDPEESPRGAAAVWVTAILAVAAGIAAVGLFAWIVR